GKDAVFLLLRDMVSNQKGLHWLDNISIVFIPIFNVDGHERFRAHNRINQNGPKEMGWRTTAKNYNLNRDYLKADASEMKDWVRLFNRWNFDFLVDCHTTNGADYQYPLTYSLEISGNLDKGLTQWIEKGYLPYVEQKMNEASFPIFPYVNFRNWHDVRTGLRNYASSLKLMNGYAAANNRICLLIETHQLKSYSVRVRATFEMLKNSLEYIHLHNKELQMLNATADANSVNLRINNSKMPLDFISDGDSVMVEFKGVHYDLKVSDFTGQTWFLYDSMRPVSYLLPFFKSLIPDNFIELPVAYVIPAEWKEIVELLKLHSVEYFELKNNVSLEVLVTDFEEVVLSSTSFEGRQMVQKMNSKEERKRVLIPSGSFVVPTAQKKVRVLAHMLEAKSGDSYLQWGFFNSIFEQKEYTESYVIEKMIPELIKDESIKTEFEDKMKTDSEFASNPRAIYNWFYSKTPYWDEEINVYPILKIDNYQDFSILEKQKNVRNLF
ncbi:MAG: M14 family zinc carboxypeptidase, partial [Bacteroidales bacterium]|nr:M14 family zinc carboxypeptidase [Bacteroidales bacterium]